MDAAVLKKKLTPDARPTASASIEPLEPPAPRPRRYGVRLRVEVNSFDEKFADRGRVISLVQSALAELNADQPASCGAVNGAKEKVIAIEAAIVCADRPDAQAIARLHDALSGAGYGVVLRELRECGNDPCTSTVTMDASRPEVLPIGWYSAEICGKHGYRSCGSCGSVYVMSSENAGGQAPSVHCEVCGTILVEWGGTKLWTAELVRKATA